MLLRILLVALIPVVVQVGAQDLQPSDFASPDYLQVYMSNVSSIGNPVFDPRGHFSRCALPNTVALTYDDGPGPYTGQVLDILKANNVTATFFVIGLQVDTPSYAPFLLRAFNEGHQIGAHTYTHPNISSLTPAALTSEMERTRASIKRVIGKTVRYMRPPFGAIDEKGYQYMFSNDYRVITWNNDPLDWQTLNTQADIDDVTNKTNILLSSGTNGMIILNHDIYPTTLAAADSIIKMLLSKGLRFVTAEECVGMRPGDAYQQEDDAQTTPNDGWNNVLEFSTALVGAAGMVINQFFA